MCWVGGGGFSSIGIEFYIGLLCTYLLAKEETVLQDVIDGLIEIGG
jgi:hypothetical protein